MLALVLLMSANVLLRYLFSIGSVAAQELEWHLMSPIVLTSSLAIGIAYDATVRWIAARDPEAGQEVMPVVSTSVDF